jgi:hypothetical protein
MLLVCSVPSRRRAGGGGDADTNYRCPADRKGCREGKSLQITGIWRFGREIRREPGTNYWDLAVRKGN